VTELLVAMLNLCLCVCTFAHKHFCAITVKVCTHLTMPSKETSKKLLSHQSMYMRQVCEAFLSEDAIAAIVTLLAEPLSKHPNMDDKDSALVELVITFLRNLLATTHPLPGSTFSEKESCKTLHISMISQFIQEDVMELFLIMAQRAREVCSERILVKR